MSKKETQADILWLRTYSFSKFLLEMFQEIYRGCLDRKIPILPVGGLCAAASIGFFVWRSGQSTHPVLSALVAGSGIWLWGLYRVCIKRQHLKKLRDIFTASGLKNSLGEIPPLVFDHATEDDSRVMRIGCALLSIDKFRDAKASLESGLRIYIDDIRDNRESGTVDILYSLKPLPTKTRLSSVTNLGHDTITIGMMRSKTILADLDAVPHLLVAGETSSGKSTFLRQAITTLFLNNKDHRFVAIDLKGGMEFGLFRNLERVQVIDSLEKATAALSLVEQELDRRLKLFAASNIKDYPSWLRSKAETTQSKGRLIVIIDEVAELFLPSALASAKELQPARSIVSRIARQGRALGIHLILGTQRPDARALDTQIKANLTGKVCFQMADITSSMVVLGSTRARDLPGIPGRAIWQRGLTMTEVQTPFLDMPEVEEILNPHRKPSGENLVSSDDKRIVRQG